MGLTDAVELAALARDCVVSQTERRALIIRLSRLPTEFRGERHQRQLREALQPVLRATRTRVFELPGGDLVAVAAPPAPHLGEARAVMARLLPDFAPAEFLPELRLPLQSAALLAAIEEALGLAAGEAEADLSATGLPPPPEELDGAERALATADISPFLRATGVWRFGPEDEAPLRLWDELRAHLGDLARELLPGYALGAAPEAAHRFRAAAERRMLADLARPPRPRTLAALSLPLSLAAATSAEFFRLEHALGPVGRRGLLVCLPPADLLADPSGVEELGRFARLRGWTLGLDDAEPELFPVLAPRRVRHGVVRLRFRAALLAAPSRERAAIDAALPEARETIVVGGADTAGAIAWAWQRGITRFAGRMVEARGGA